MKHILIYGGIAAILLIAVDPDTTPFKAEEITWWSHFLENVRDRFRALTLICGIPFLIGILLIPHRANLQVETKK